MHGPLINTYIGYIVKMYGNKNLGEPQNQPQNERLNLFCDKCAMVRDCPCPLQLETWPLNAVAVQWVRCIYGSENPRGILELDTKLKWKLTRVPGCHSKFFITSLLI